MTINLEQLGHVTNTVMDRIHAPVSGKTATSAAYEVDQGRYFWIDASTMKGGVDSYDNLAGFGYQLSSIVLGRDLLRDPSGGFGVFGGVGYTTMTQMDQVVQSFSSTNYYLGLYGGKYLSNDFKLLGAAGYVYSDSTAARANPDIGNFTGGTAKSQYQSNGAYAALKLSRPILASQHVTLTPFIGASYVQSWMNQANESGGRDLIAFASGQCAQNDALPAQVLE
ncbi:autotransporter outer membrane beta-barrel domain-containing protein [Dechloromonas sp. HYN0024]|nr:autotransporter outer membrane beta-barrel domain-containing protein [Dechloromonas sp. HYN0024]